MPGGERVLDFSASPARLSVRHQQLVVRREDGPEVTVPLAEIASIILAHAQVTPTQPVLASLMRAGGTIIVCDDLHQPVGMMLPLVSNAIQTKRIIAQASASKPLCKRLWKDIVQAKLRSQAATLEGAGRGDGGLRALAKRVRSGDPMNVEAQAAVRYWPLLFNDPDFRRRRDAEDQNRLLNYGYAVLRAATGRALCAAGLHPSLGVHHRSRENPWCLCDDVMEPYRPLIDAAVVELVGLYGKSTPLDGESKQALVSVLTDRVTSEGEQRTVFDWLSRTAASLAQIFVGETDRIFYPRGLRHA